METTHDLKKIDIRFGKDRLPYGVLEFSKEESSNLSAAYYKPFDQESVVVSPEGVTLDTNERLILRFRSNNNLYYADEVSLDHWEQLRNCESPGKFYHYLLKPNYKFFPCPK